MGGEKKRTLCCQNTRRLDSENKTLSSTSLWRKYYVPTFHNLLVNFMLIFTFFQLTKISFTNLLTYLRLVRQMSFREIGIFKHSILRKTSSIHFLCVKLFRLCYVHYEITNFTHYSKRIRGQVDELEIPPTNFLQNCKFGQRRSFLIPYYVFTS